MSNPESIYYWGTDAPLPLSRVWVCSNCGTKVYYGKLVAQPNHRCFCGKEIWQTTAGAWKRG